jgi:membrane peptidoglycan carboxypeptidase
MPEMMKKAVLAIEDDQFYEHGIDQLPQCAQRAGGRHPLGRVAQRRLDHHDAGGAQFSS